MITLLIILMTIALMYAMFVIYDQKGQLNSIYARRYRREIDGPDKKDIEFLVNLFPDESTKNEAIYEIDSFYQGLLSGVGLARSFNSLYFNYLDKQKSETK